MVGQFGRKVVASLERISSANIRTVAWNGEDLWNATKKTNESREIMTRVTAAREGIWKDITLDVTKLLNCFY